MSHACLCLLLGLGIAPLRLPAPPDPVPAEAMRQLPSLWPCPAPEHDSVARVEAARDAYWRRRLRVLDDLTTEGERPRPLSATAFYETIGRPDLARAYQRRRATRLGLRIGGPLLVTGGIALWFGTASLGKDETGPAVGMMVGGLLLGAAGTIAYLVGGRIEVHPMDLPSRQAAASEYNERIVHLLGLD